MSMHLSNLSLAAEPLGIHVLYAKLPTGDSGYSSEDKPGPYLQELSVQRGRE